MRLNIEQITPAEAERLLRNNTANRNPRLKVISRYARDMREGRWVLTGDPVKIAETGELIDGQHRLMAVIESGVTVQMAMARGVPISAKPVLDTGATRTTADVLRWRGETCATALAACIGFGWRFDRGVLLQPVRGTTNELLEWLEKNPGIRQSVAATTTVRQRVRVPWTALAAAHYVTSRVNVEDAEVFFHHLREGAGLDVDSPVLALRRWAERLANRRDRPQTETYFAYTLKAINLWRQGRGITTLVWRHGGANGEAFPSVWTDEAEAA